MAYCQLRLCGLVLSWFRECCLRTKRAKKIDEMPWSSTVAKLLDMVGRGRLDIACATDLARAVLEDLDENHATITRMASLGAYGAAPSNSERDLHTWMGGLFGLHLETYSVPCKVKAQGSEIYIGCNNKRFHKSYRLSFPIPRSTDR